MKHSERFLKIVNHSKTRVREIDINGVRKLREAGEDFALVDVREDTEWSAGHAAGAIHLGKGVIERDVEQTIPDTGKKIVLYCGGGFRSALAADALQTMGYTNVLSLAGGWRAWNEAGLETEK